MTSGSGVPLEYKDRLDGNDLRAMFGCATQVLEQNVESINSLNVFPVPDGDTGTNMFLTMRAVVEGAQAHSSHSCSEVADAMASSALMGARGNSGVILSQFFKGISLGLQGASDFGAKELVASLHQAREHAYRAVGEPVEGTMLTVISSVAEAAEACLGKNGTVQAVCDAASTAARESVALTPTLLPVLKEAGVVDAGGQGLAVILEGVRRSVNGEDASDAVIQAPDPIGVEQGLGRVSADFLAATDQEVYGYCTQFIIEGEGLDLEGVRVYMMLIARSTVVVGDDSMLKVHVHADDPGPVLSLGVTHGTLAQVNIRNMDEQHAEFSSERRQEVTTVQEELGVAVVAVAQGEGLKALFTSLAASGMVTGGDTMNPSVGDLLEAMESAPSENVLVLPNNRNIVPAARQAAEASTKTVRVVESRSIPQGVAAILAFNPDRDLESNGADMEDALGSVRSAEITKAVRGVTLDGVSVEPGRLIGLLERELVAAGDDLAEVLTAVLRKAALSTGDLVTLYWGEPVAADVADATLTDVASIFPGVEFELVKGGQPHYHYLVSIE